MFWDIEDEQNCKKKLIDKLRDKHGKSYVDKTIKYFIDLGLSTNNIFKPYLNMPDLHIITNMFDSKDII